MAANNDLTGIVLDGRYRLVRLMGEGGMGQVYEGVHDTLDRKVAVKILLPRFAYDARFRERFLREAKAASKVRHPNVVQILDFGDTPNGSVYFAMEYLEGRDLRHLLHETGALPWPRARHLLLQITSALAAAHERGVIHRDLKPANFFISEARGFNDFVKVLDFGIAKIAAGSSGENSVAKSLTGTGQVFGTAKYMAPEQAYGSSDDPRVDVYSVGIVAYEILTGTLPFDGGSAFEIITRHVNDPPRPPRELNPAIPSAVEAVILKALSKKAEGRQSSMEELEHAFGSIPANVGTRGRLAPGLSPALRRRMQPDPPPATGGPAAPPFPPTRARPAPAAGQKFSVNRAPRPGAEPPAAAAPSSPRQRVATPTPAPESVPTPTPTPAPSEPEYPRAETVIAPAPRAPTPSGSFRPVSTPDPASPSSSQPMASQPEPYPAPAPMPAAGPATGETMVAQSYGSDAGYTMAAEPGHDTSPSGTHGPAPITSSSGLQPGVAPSPTSSGLQPGVAPSPTSSGLQPGAAPSTSSSGLQPGAAPSTSSSGLQQGAVQSTSSSGLQPFPANGAASSSSSATAPIQDGGDPRAATGPLDSYPGGPSALETDQQDVFPPPRSHRLLIGLLGVAGMAIAFTLVVFAFSDDDQPAPSEPKDVAAAVVPSSDGEDSLPAPADGGETPTPSDPVPEDVSSADDGTEPTAGDGADPAADEGATPAGDDGAQPIPEDGADGGIGDPPPSDDDKSNGVRPEDTTEPAPKPSSKPKPKPKEPPTDSQLQSRLVRKMKRKCRSLGSGERVNVELLVASSGKVLGKKTPGTSGELSKCILDQAAKAEFNEGSTRTFKLKVDL